MSQAISPLARAQALRPAIQAAADVIDSEREIPNHLVAKLKADNMLRLLVPKSMGGEEMDWREYFDVILEIAQGDGSVGWCINQGAVFSINSARKPRYIAEKIWSIQENSVGNGPPSGATSKRVKDGYEISGQWNFSSGCRHATWLAALVKPEGEKADRLHYVPKDQMEMRDVWQVAGLRGTGSFSFGTDKLVVPEEHTMPMDQGFYEEGPLYLIPQTLMFACGFGTVALGNARAGLDSVVELAQSKKPMFGRLTLSQEPVVQFQVAQAEAIWRSAKAGLFTTIETVWESVKRKGFITMDERLDLRLAGTHAIREAKRVVDIAYNLTGSNAIFATTKIQRHFQDAHAITQQVQGRESHYQVVGQHLLGHEVLSGIF